MFACRILHKGGVLFWQENVDFLVFQSAKGPYMLTQKHTFMKFVLLPGYVYLKRGNKTYVFFLEKGFLSYDHYHFANLVTKQALTPKKEDAALYAEKIRKGFLNFEIDHSSDIPE